MKKIILATAVASMIAPMVAMADTTVYGGLRMSLVTGEKGTADIGGLVNNASRIGVKGSYGEEGGLTGFFNIQEGVQTDVTGGSGFTNRFAFAGVKGGFGKVVVGRLSSPYKMAGLKLDPFYDTSAGPLNGGSNYGLSSLTNGWLNNVVGYITPKLGGAVTLNLVAVLDENDNGPNIAATENFYNIGAEYSKNGFTAGVQHITEIDTTRLTAGYKNPTFSAGVSYEDFDSGSDMTYVAGTYKIAPKTTLAASFGTNGGNGTGARNAAGDGYTLGVFQKIAPKTTVSALYSSVDYDAAAEGDRDIFAVGLIQNF